VRVVAASSEPTDRVALRGEIARRLDTSRLPLARGPRIFGSYGQNQSCDCCDCPILVTDVLYECELEGESTTILLAMHRWCFDLWVEQSALRREMAYEDYGRVAAGK
jgi:hypothetical protein